MRIEGGGWNLNGEHISLLEIGASRRGITRASAFEKEL
jgi:hypothetical protein